MKAAEATDSIRGAHNLPCSARDVDKKEDQRGGESYSVPAIASTALSCKKQLPNSHAHALAPADDTKGVRNPVLANLMQTGGFKSRQLRAPMAASTAPSMERRKRCCCSSDSHGGLNVGGSCNCNMENCSWFPSVDDAGDRVASSFKAQHVPWRSVSDQSNANAALHRALSAMKKVSGEPEAVKKVQARAIHPRNGSSDGYGAWAANLMQSEQQREQVEMSDARLITTSDARTLSMRERGRWGNSKMQQQLFAQPAASAHGGLQSQAHHRHPQALQHVQCLHCGSFSTTPVAKGVATSARSNSFGRKVRDYSWQQELLQEQKRPAEQQEQQAKEAVRQDLAATAHHRCQYACCADMFQDEHSAATVMKVQGSGSVMSWQERYMLLCQAIAAGAFIDSGGADDMSGPIVPASHGYSWAVCECATCEMGGAAGGFRHSTSAEARMMELEAFSGPLGYASESKAGTDLSDLMQKRPSGRRRWWMRLPSFGKPKSSVQTAPAPAGRMASGQNTAQCSSCGQRVWSRGGEEEELGGRLCPDCIVRTGSTKCESGPLPGPTAATRPTAARGRPRPPPPPAFTQHKHLPRRWRLMKLCRYLMGFPLQRK